jgi:hypothetical protein
MQMIDFNLQYITFKGTSSLKYWEFLKWLVLGYLAIVRILGTNMAWLMKVVQDGKENHWIPEKEKKVWTSFVR